MKDILVTKQEARLEGLGMSIPVTNEWMGKVILNGTINQLSGTVRGKTDKQAAREGKKGKERVNKRTHHFSF